MNENSENLLNENNSTVDNNGANNEEIKEGEYMEFKQALEEINAELNKEQECENSDNDTQSENLSSNQSEKCEEEQNTESAKSQEKEESACSNGNSNNENATTVTSGDYAQEDKGSLTVEKDGDEEDENVKLQYKQYRLNKLYSKINYDLAYPELTVSVLKGRIADGATFNFNSYLLLTSKIKAVKKRLKLQLHYCAVIGNGDSTALAKRWEIRQTKWLKVSDIQLIAPLSVIKEGKKRPLVKELSKYRKIAGNKINFKIAIDASKLNAEEFNFTVDCAILAKPKAIVIINCDSLNLSHLLTLAKKCSGKCALETDVTVNSSKDISSYTEKGIDAFNVKNAVALAHTLKIE